MEVNSLGIRYPSEILWALQQEPDEFEENARLLLALKLYETGRLSTGLAARMAVVPRVTFMFLLGQHGLSPFGETADELEEDLSRARSVPATGTTPSSPITCGAFGVHSTGCESRC